MRNPKTRLLVYKMSSSSGKKLARNLGLLRITRVLNRYRPRSYDTIINWGSTCEPVEVTQAGAKVLNPALAVQKAVDKRKCFAALESAPDVNIPEWTTSPDEAQSWLEEGSSIVCRSFACSHGGRGITVVDDPHVTLDICPLYSKYIKKKYEYRAHVLPCGSFHLVQKRRSYSVPLENVDWRIRSHERGFIYAQELAYVPSDIEAVSKAAIYSLGLNFGAIDIVYSTQYNKSYVLEVNTAPGLEGTTLEKYTESLKQII